MTKKIIISEKDNIGAVMEGNKAVEIFAHKGEVLLGDVYLAKVDNVLPSIEAAFVDVGMDRMGFIHTNDIMGKGTLKEKVRPNQKLIVQVIKEPTGHKGPRVTTAISLPGRFLVMMPGEVGISVSKKITSSKERARLKSIVNLLKPVGIGFIVRTEAEGQSEGDIQEDIEMLLEKWNSIVNLADIAEPPTLLYRDQDLLYRVIREACDEEVDEIVVDSPFSLHKTSQLLQHWNVSNKIKVTLYKDNEPLLVKTGVAKEIINALKIRVDLPLGGYLFIQQTEALTVVDVNSGKFVSSASQAETILKTNLQAADEIARQLKLRNIGGMVVVDFIDMTSRMDKLALLEHFELALEKDKAKPQVGQLSDLGLVELTRHRQGQSLVEIFTKKCDKCGGDGFIIEDLRFSSSNAQAEQKAKMNKIKGPFAPAYNQNTTTNKNKYDPNRNNKNKKAHNKDNDAKPVENIQENPSEINITPQTQNEANIENTNSVQQENIQVQNDNKPNKKSRGRKKTKPKETKTEDLTPKNEITNETSKENTPKENRDNEAFNKSKLSNKPKSKYKKGETAKPQEQNEKTNKSKKEPEMKQIPPQEQKNDIPKIEQKPKKQPRKMKKASKKAEAQNAS